MWKSVYASVEKLLRLSENEFTLNVNDFRLNVSDFR